MSSATPEKAANPFVGPRSLQLGESIFGREQETRKLANLLLANRIILMHSPSGAGKTSLIQAALIPRLASRNFHVLPGMRLNLGLPEGLASADGVNPYVYSALLSLEEAQPAEARLPLAELARTSLSAYLDRMPEARLLLIFDQFEEILTYQPLDRAGKTEFFEQAGAALEAPNRWALFSIREDYLGGLDPYVLPVPTRFKYTFRLDLLEREAAREVAQSTAALGGVNFTEPAVRRLLDDLTCVQVQLPDGSLDAQPGIYVEPVHLQVVCHYLWEKRDPHDPDITADEIEQIGSVDDSLAAYYDARVAAAAQETGVPERQIRTWFDRQLVTETGIRSPVLMGQGATAGLSNAAIQKLVDAHLVRRDTRRGTTWFELAHDRLVAPVRRSNAAWFEKHLRVLQRQAARWQAEGRPEHLLLRGAVLDEEDAWAGEHSGDLSEEDRLFLEACCEARQKEEDALRLAEELRRSKTQRRFLVVVSAALVITLALFIYSVFQTANAVRLTGAANQASTQIAGDALARSTLVAISQDKAATAQFAQAVAIDQQAEALAQKATAEALKALAEASSQEAIQQSELAQQNASLALSRQLAAQGSSLLGVQPDLAGLLGAEAYAINHTLESKSLLLALLRTRGSESFEPVEPRTPDQTDPILSLATSPDGRHLAYGSVSGSVAVWDYRDNVFKDGWPQKALSGNVLSLAFSPDGRWLAVGGIRPELKIFSMTTNSLESSLAVSNRTYALAFHPSLPELAAVELNRVVIWNTQTWTHLTVSDQEPDWIQDLAWSPDGTLLAAGEFADQEQPNPGLVIYDGRTLQKKLTFPQPRTINSVDWSPDGSLVATGSSDGFVRLYDLNAGKEIGSPIAPSDAPVEAVSFSPDGKFLARASGEDITLYTTASFQEIGRKSSPDGEMVVGLSYVASPLGQLLAAAFSLSDTRNFVHLYRTAEVHELSTTVLFGDTPPRALADLPGPRVWRVEVVENRLQVVYLDEDPNSALFGIQETVFARDLPKPAGEKSSGQTAEEAAAFNAVALSQSGDFLAVWPENWPLEIYRLPSGERVQRIDFQAQNEIVLAISPDGSRVAAGYCPDLLIQEGRIFGCNESAIRIWDTASGAQVGFDLIAHDDFLSALAFTPDGRRLASGSINRTIHLWDLDRMDVYGLPLQNPGGAVSSLSFSPDGALLASGSSEGRVVLFELPDQRPILPSLDYGASPVTALAFSPDGLSLVAGYVEEGAVLRWNVDFDSWQRLACALAGRPLSGDEITQYFPEGGYTGVCAQ